MASLQLLLVFLTALAFTEGSTINPCDPNNHKMLNEPHRSTGYEVSYPGRPICDRYLEPRWYRFTSRAGGVMPTQCPKRNQCGTLVPIWMKGSHPSVKDGVVIRKVCANFNSRAGVRPHCCENSRSIRVLNCGSFYIYQLRPTPSCPMAYCAGDLRPCPQGKWSPTSFPPCRDGYPLMTTRPRLSGPLTRFKSFGFSCKFEFPKQDPDQRFEVTWTFEGEEVPNVAPKVLSDPQREMLLDGWALTGHINKNIRCRVRSYYESIGKENSIGIYMESNAYYAGIKISPSKIELSPKDHVKNLTITSTIPIICNQTSDCYLVFTLGTDQSQYVSAAKACDFKLWDKNWNPETNEASINVSLTATQDIVDFGDQQALVTFQKLLPAGGGPYQDVFFGHVPDSIHVEVQSQKTTKCSITGDPHIVGHEFGMYHLYLAGDFTVYKVASLDFEIQIRTWPCGSRPVTCVCGVSIREKNDIIRINQCDQPYGRPSTSPTIRSPYKLSEGTLIKRSKDSKTIAVYLPSGAQIKIQADPLALALYITSTGSHEGLARGICGSNDGNKRNEFTHPDGTIDPICSNKELCLPNSFFKSWQLATDSVNNLFESTPPRVDTFNDNNIFCKCRKERKTAAITCNKKDDILGCPGCPDVVPEPIDDGWNKRSAAFEDRDVPDTPYVAKSLPMVNVSKTWPNAHGVTESQARQMCSQALQASKLWSHKDKMGNLSGGILSTCMIDILFGDTTDFVKTVTDQFTTECQLELAKDPQNYITDPSGETIMKPELLTDICPRECDDHGHCGDGGKCICNDGWEGEVCQIDSKKGPQLIMIRSGSICDNQKRPCKRIFVDATNIDFTEDLSCSIQFLDDQGNAVGKPTTTQAILITGGRISCELPETDASSQDFKISATNNGQVFGNELGIRVFDSRCLKCDPTSTNCTQQPYACHINKKCYDDQQANPSNWRQRCDITQNTTDWTNLPRLPFIPQLSGPTQDQLFICKFTPPSDVTGQFKVTWYLDSKALSHKTLTRLRAYLDETKVVTSGKLTCVIEKNGAYAESNILNYIKT